MLIRKSTLKMRFSLNVLIIRLDILPGLVREAGLIKSRAMSVPRFAKKESKDNSTRWLVFEDKF